LHGTPRSSPTQVDPLPLGGCVPKTDTVAVGKTDIPGLEGVTFEGGSHNARTEAGLKDWADDPVLANGDIQSPPNLLPQYRNHAESNVLSGVDDAMTRQFATAVRAMSAVQFTREGFRAVVQRIARECGVTLPQWQKEVLPGGVRNSRGLHQ